MYKIQVFFGSLLLVATLLISCSESSVSSGISRSFDAEPWLEKGKSIQSESFAALSGQLMTAMQNGGVKEAIRYCNLAAYPLTDSLSALHHVHIRRATLKPRNPDNRASETESSILQDYSKRNDPNDPLRPVAMDNQQTIEYFAPILVQAQCLSCHGIPGKDIRMEDLQLIKHFYPKDKATGYQIGDLRGIWHITFKK